MRTAAWAIAPIVLLAAPPAAAQDAAVRQLVERFEAARLAFDPAMLAETLAPGYEEISPVGDVDTRAQVLGFYAPDQKRAAPPMTTDEFVVRSFGDFALVTARKALAIPGAPLRAIRVRYVAHRIDGAWRLVSTQYTPVPPRKAAASPD